VHLPPFSLETLQRKLTANPADVHKRPTKAFAKARSVDSLVENQIFG